MELLKCIKHNNLCLVCNNSSNNNCDGCNYTSMGKRNMETYKQIVEVMKSKNIVVPTLIDYEGKLR